MKNLKYAFKPVPERFHYSVQSAIDKAVLTEKKRSRLSRPVKAVIAVSLVATILPTSVFGAAQLYNYVVNKSGNYGVEVKADNSVSSPKYVKLKVKPIEGFEVMNHTDGLKYNRVGDQGGSGYSFMLIRSENGSGELYKSVKDYKKTSINSHEAVIMKKAGTTEDNTTVSIYYENVNIILTCFVDSDIKEKDMLKALSGVEIVKGTKKDHTEYFEADNYEPEEDISQYTVDTSFTQIKTGQQVEFNNDIDSTLKYSVDNIRVVDNVAELNRDDFEFWGDDVNNYINDDGSLKPRKSTIYEFGDGINSVDKLIKKENKKQKFILADITYTDTTSKSQEFGINANLVQLEKKNGKLGYIDTGNTGDTNADDGYPNYIANANQGKDYYRYEVSAGESRTFTIGFRCDEDLLSKSYIQLDGPVSETSYDYYVVKVQ